MRAECLWIRIDEKCRHTKFRQYRLKSDRLAISYVLLGRDGRHFSYAHLQAGLSDDIFVNISMRNAGIPNFIQIGRNLIEWRSYMWYWAGRVSHAPIQVGLLI